MDHDWIKEETKKVTQRLEIVGLVLGLGLFILKMLQKMLLT